MVIFRRDRPPSKGNLTTQPCWSILTGRQAAVAPEGLAVVVVVAVVTQGRRASSSL